MANALCNKAGVSCRAKAAEHILGKTNWAFVSGVLLHLYTGDPTTADTGGTEVTGGSYAATAITWGSASDAGVISNSADIEFPAATADWAAGATKVTYGIIKDGAGTPFSKIYFAFDVAKNVLSGDTVRIAAGDLSITVA